MACKTNPTAAPIPPQSPASEAAQLRPKTSSPQNLSEGTPSHPPPKANQGPRVSPEPSALEPSAEANSAISAVALPSRFADLSWIAGDTIAVGRIGIEALALGSRSGDPKAFEALSQRLRQALDTPPASSRRSLPMFLAFALRGLTFSLNLQLTRLKGAQILPLEAALLVTAQRNIALLWPLPLPRARARAQDKNQAQTPSRRIKHAVARAFARELELHAGYWSLKATGQQRNTILGLSQQNTLVVFLTPLSPAQRQAFLESVQEGSSHRTLAWIPKLPRPGSSGFYLSWVGHHLLETPRQSLEQELPVVGEISWLGPPQAQIRINGAPRSTP